ncbi:sugar transferase [Listeria newyorkensis]|uniref:Sugar transferase n=1 Tax=Listeria newyorkensis TaxID=1497681 RepID=A0ABX4XKE9_9LIST|nr:sugar transferase [Listeria newyorkensis]PNP89379.1 sugar transferase [Listeria newyorkensis]WAO22951.1 sugar transferase [Listeria newyorkensis]SQC57229.1 Putative colanic biosynthesis UDP-glucose lipid carrier transferase [Listeria newyorkensis]
MYIDTEKEITSFPYTLRKNTMNDMLIRAVDIIAALFALLISSPVMIVVAILIKLEDGAGPIIFKQTRVGHGGKLFDMYKFRSMYTDAEMRLDELMAQNEVEGNMFKMKNDPRITKVGKIIRKLSLDEFPQFINVLKGDMSMVGPRPPLEREYENYSDRDKKRLLVKPGCTGLWQVSGRNELSFDQMINLDLEYIEKRNIFFNLKIMLLTFKEITVFGKGM